jgi:glycosyltransferase involved in cell wall biosynthesis
MKFSVITISFNHAEFIEKTITSVLDQKYPNFEHIIIDGGSTDGTVEILKKYPHLNWISEKDSGLSNALNKGMRKATGDVIAWINSDDFYQPDAFHSVAEAMKNNDIVLGDSFEADRQGNPIKVISNKARTLFDLEKYWVPKAWLSQPSVFFTRKALELVKLPNGDYLDETFRYSMDFDLWLRLAEKYSFLNYIPKTLSSFRVYGDNLTGKTFASPQRELGRAFRKSYARRFPSERPHEIIIPVCKLTKEFGALLDQLLQQPLQNFQITVIDTLTNHQESSAIKDVIEETEETTTLVNLRYRKATGATLEEALEIGFSEAVGDIVSILPSTASVEKHFSAQVMNLFAHDVYGAAAYLNDESHGAYSRLLNIESGIVDPNALLNNGYEFIPFGIRKGMLHEIGELYPQNPFTFLSDILLKIIAKGWLIPVEKNSGVRNATIERDKIIAELFKPYQKAKLFFDLLKFGEEEPFQSVRIESSYAPRFDLSTLETVKSFLDSLPSSWWRISKDTPEDELKQIIHNHQQFAPAWYFLAQYGLKRNDTAFANEAFKVFKQLRPDWPYELV